MNFGFRLPGPFRVGVNSRGGVNVGITAGPFSASTGIGSRRPTTGEPFHPTSLDGAVGELVVAGWQLTGHDGHTAILTRGWKAVQVEAVDGGVTWRPVTSRRAVIAWTLLALAVVALCAGIAA